MNPGEIHRLLCRRSFLRTSGSGLGVLALASLLREEGLLATQSAADQHDPLAPKRPPFAPRAKAAIFIHLEGAPSQLDLFDPKPELVKQNGQQIPESLLKDAEFSFIKKDKAFLKGADFKFHKRGESGVEYSELLPHIGACADDICLIRSLHTTQFNHHPADLLLHSGKPEFGRPTIGSWLLYGLGSFSRELPGYVVLNTGRGGSASASIWSSGFLPTTYQGVPFRTEGEPVLNLANPRGVDASRQERALAAITQLNAGRLETVHDSEIASRISQYELAFRMQTSAPKLIDLGDETQRTLEDYGVNRPTPLPTAELQPSNTYSRFATNCLMARRLVERGVRYVSLIHSSWDQHSKLKYDLTWNCGAVDQPIAALLKDLKQRGLLDETLVIWGTEFGRTPLAEIGTSDGSKTNGDGRDHHPHAFSMWMAGGGAKGGHVHGETDDIGWFPIKNPVDLNDFQATLLHLFGIDHKRLTANFKGLDLRLTNQGGNVIHQALA
jgi:hypothetical protein